MNEREICGRGAARWAIELACMWTQRELCLTMDVGWEGGVRDEGGEGGEGGSTEEVPAEEHEVGLWRVEIVAGLRVWISEVSAGAMVVL